MNKLIEKLEELERLLVSINEELYFACNENYDMHRQQVASNNDTKYVEQMQQQIQQIRQSVDQMKSKTALFNSLTKNKF